MISVKLLNHGIEYVCILECVCVCVCVCCICLQMHRAQDGSQEAWLQFPAWPWATLRRPLKFRLSQETVLEGSLLRSLIPQPLLTEHLPHMHHCARDTGSAVSLSVHRLTRSLCSGLPLWWTSWGVRCKQIHRVQAGEKSPTGHRPCRM